MERTPQVDDQELSMSYSSRSWTQISRQDWGAGSDVWVCKLTAWMSLCLLPTHSSSGSNLHLNRDFFFFNEKDPREPPDY